MMVAIHSPEISKIKVDLGVKATPEEPTWRLGAEIARVSPDPTRSVLSKKWTKSGTNATKSISK